MCVDTIFTYHKIYFSKKKKKNALKKWIDLMGQISYLSYYQLVKNTHFPFFCAIHQKLVYFLTRRRVFSILNVTISM